MVWRHRLPPRLRMPRPSRSVEISRLAYQAVAPAFVTEEYSFVLWHQHPDATTKIENHLRCFTPLYFCRPQPGRPDAQP